MILAISPLASDIHLVALGGGITDAPLGFQPHAARPVNLVRP